MPADPRRIKEVFAGALDRADPAERAAYLDSACAGDPALRRRVEALLPGPANTPTLYSTARRPSRPRPTRPGASPARAP